MDDATRAATAPPGGPGGVPGRRRRLAALAFDVATALIAGLAATLVAMGWLLARTGWGHSAPASGDTMIGAAIVLAAFPVWAAWAAARAARGVGTAGQAVFGLRVETTAPRRRARGRVAGGPLVRLAAHPLAALAWLWLAACAVLLDRPWIAAGCAVGAAAWTLAGAVSGVLLLRDRSARPLHDRLARTRLCAR